MTRRGADLPPLYVEQGHLRGRPSDLTACAFLVKVEGQVAQPGKYPLGQNMTAAELVLLAGGLKRGAYTETADLTRYQPEQGASVVGEHSAVELARALTGDANADTKLRDGDVLTIREIAGWNDVGATITIKGEVLHPGTYGIQEGERLSSILARAGGFRSEAYPHGIIFERLQVRELEQANRQQLIRQVQMDGSSLTLIPDSDQDGKGGVAAKKDRGGRPGGPNDDAATQAAKKSWRCGRG